MSFNAVDHTILLSNLDILSRLFLFSIIRLFMLGFVQWYT